MKTCDNSSGQNGFTLIEVIISLIIFGIMGSMLFVFLSSAVVRSTEPVAMTRDLALAQDAMEVVISAYNKCLVSGPAYDDCTEWNNFISDCSADPNCDGSAQINGMPVYRYTYTEGDQTLSTFLPPLY